MHRGVQVACTQDCLKLLQRGDANRVFAATEMNAHSSRSHAIVIITVFKQRKRATKRVKNGDEVVGRCARRAMTLSLPTDVAAHPRQAVLCHGKGRRPGSNNSEQYTRGMH